MHPGWLAPRSSVEQLEEKMAIEDTKFGSITIDGKTYEHDVIVCTSFDLI